MHSTSAGVVNANEQSTVQRAGTGVRNLRTQGTARPPKAEVVLEIGAERELQVAFAATNAASLGGYFPKV